MSDYMKVETKRQILLNSFLKLKKATTNEAIDYVFENDMQKGRAFVVKRGWRFYVHLNKQTKVLEDLGLLEHVANKMGKLGREEKVWKVIK